MNGLRARHSRLAGSFKAAIIRPLVFYPDAEPGTWCHEDRHGLTEEECKAIAAEQGKRPLLIEWVDPKPIGRQEHAYED